MAVRSATVDVSPSPGSSHRSANSWITPTPAADRRTRTLQLRHANIMLGFISSLAVMLANTVYLATTPDAPNRPLLWGLQAVAIGFGLTTVLAARRRHLGGRALTHVWTLSQVVVIAAAVAADGGLGSPFLVLIFLPLALTSMALRPPAVVAHTATAIVGLVAAGYVTATLSLGSAMIWSATIASLALVGAGVGENTRRLTRKLEDTNQELMELSRSDPLTGCLNHRSFYEEVDVVLARATRSRTPVSLLLLDLDHFKLVNDEHGHPVGDAVLVAVADALRTSTRAGDVVARTGGEEFAILMPDTVIADAETISERVRTAVAEADSHVPVTVSAGLAAFPEHGRTSSRLVRIADNALYDAKRAGRDQLVRADG